MIRFVLVLSIMALTSCAKESPGSRTDHDSHLKYFGFTLIDTYWDDPTDGQVKTNYINEVSGFTNVADILVVAPSDDIKDRRTAMHELQVKSILHVWELFFELVGTNSPSGAEYSLRSDYSSRWDDFISINDLQANQDLVQAFYIGEEPTWNGISFSDLKSAADYVELTIPNIPIMIIEAYPAIDQLQIPTSVDWVGFDHYFIRDPKSDLGYLSEMNVLKSKFSTTDQSLVVVMDSHYISSVHRDFGGISIEEMADVANSYYELAKSEEKAIAILGYFWPSGFDHPESIGARNMPESIKENYIRIGQEITEKN